MGPSACIIDDLGSAKKAANGFDPKSEASRSLSRLVRRANFKIANYPDPAGRLFILGADTPEFL
jgi:hypothetical protein